MRIPLPTSSFDYDTSPSAVPLRQQIEEAERSLASSFPSGFAGRSVDGIELISLDMDIAGTMSRYVKSPSTSLTCGDIASTGLEYADATWVSLALIGREAAHTFFARRQRVTHLVLLDISRGERGYGPFVHAGEKVPISVPSSFQFPYTTLLLEQAKDYYFEEFDSPNMPPEWEDKSIGGVHLGALHGQICQAVVTYLYPGDGLSRADVAELGLYYADAMQVLPHLASKGEIYELFEMHKRTAQLILLDICTKRWRDAARENEIVQPEALEKWGDAVCSSCNVTIAVWADLANGVCSRCGHPLPPV